MGSEDGPVRLMFEYLDPSLWNYLGRIRWCGLGGGESLVVGHSQLDFSLCLLLSAMCLYAAVLSTIVVMDSLSETISSC